MPPPASLVRTPLVFTLPGAIGSTVKHVLNPPSQEVWRNFKQPTDNRPDDGCQQIHDVDSDSSKEEGKT
jgi:hypothetical protein